MNLCDYWVLEEVDLTLPPLKRGILASSGLSSFRLMSPTPSRFPSTSVCSQSTGCPTADHKFLIMFRLLVHKLCRPCFHGRLKCCRATTTSRPQVFHFGRAFCLVRNTNLAHLSTFGCVSSLILTQSSEPFTAR